MLISLLLYHSTGSGEFHVYKQARRREYERLKLMEEEDAKVSIINGGIVFSRSIPDPLL